MAAPPEVSKKGPPGASARSRPTRRRGVPGRTLWFAAALLVFLVSTGIALTRPPRPDVFRPPELFSWAWWTSPVEWNGAARLTAFTGEIRSITTVPGTETVWVAGLDGLLIRSSESGRSWESVALPDSARLVQPRGVDRGGNPLPANPTRRAPHLYDITFADEDHGWIASSHGRVLATSDGGRSWTVGPHVQPVTPIPRIVAVDFADAELGWAVGGDLELYRTRDGGETWETTGRFGFGTPVLLELLPGGVGWAVAADGVLWSTEDAGDSFEPVAGVEDLEPLAGARAAATRRADDAGSGFRLMAEARAQEAPDPQAPAPSPAQQAPEADPQADIVGLDVLSAEVVWVVVRRGTRDDGYRSTVHATRDGGRSWRTLLERPGELGHVHVADEERGTVTGVDGRVYVTDDGGATWNESVRASGTPRNVRRGLAMDADGRLWAAGDEWLVEASQDGGRTWYAPAATGTLHDVTFQGEERGWAVGDGGLVLATDDGGDTWEPRDSGTRSNLHAVAFADTDRGWVVGEDATVLATTDGGDTWRAERAASEESFVDVAAAGEDPVWAVTEDGELFARSADGTWGRGTEPLSPRLGGAALHMAADSTLWAVAEGSLVRSSPDGSRQPVGEPASDLPVEPVVRDLYLSAEGTGWALSRVFVGTWVFRIEDGGRTWAPDTLAWPGDAPSDPTALAFLDPELGWIAGTNGVVRLTDDGGTSWRGAPDTARVTLRDLHVVDASRVWAVGDAVTILTSADGGETWADPREPRTAPPPLYFLSWLLVAGLLAPTLRRPEAEAAPEESVADSLASDRPITSPEHDTLGLGRLARGISRFVRNVETEPPLTLAVTGPWGSGKSSLLNLVCEDLRDRGFRPVWFNAWHHQKEEHLLASLLANIRAQAVPGWITPSGLGFRLRLLGLRAWRDRWLILGLVVVLAASTGYFVRHGETLSAAPGDIVGHVVDLVPMVGDEPEEPGEHGDFSGPTVVALLASLGGLLLGGLRGLAAFRVSPASLLAGVSRRAGIRQFDAQLGFRHRFAREFGDVTRALQPRTMVIVIDDLDRCRPRNVLEVLEAVNFLVSCGDCFVLMGMDVDRVVRCVGMGFKDVAEELADEAGLPGERLGAAQHLLHSGTESPEEELDPEERGRRRRTRFAYQYLEKLVNIEVPVPKPEAAQTEQLLLSERKDGEGGGPGWRRRLTRGSALIAVPAMVALAFWLGWASPGRETREAADAGPRTPVTLTRSPQSAERAGGSARPEGEGGGGAVAGDPGLAEPSASFRLIPGAAGRGPRWSVVLPLLALGLVGLGLGLRSAPVVERDSPEFKAALMAVHPLVVRRRNNPRTIKRFLNRVRYYAMVQDTNRPDERSPLLDRVTEALARTWSRARAAWRGRDLSTEGEPRAARRGESEREAPESGHGPVPSAADSEGSGNVPEDVLVLLAAVQHLRPEWLREEGFRSDPAGFVLDRLELDERDASDVRDFAGWTRMEDAHLEAFGRLSRDVRVL